MVLHLVCCFSLNHKTSNDNHRSDAIRVQGHGSISIQDISGWTHEHLPRQQTDELRMVICDRSLMSNVMC